jgi:protein-tyrosine phosphatase
MDPIPTGAVDLHFHILPGVDDGPATMADSLELALAAVQEGTRTVVATPHVRSDFVTDPRGLPGRVGEVQRALRAEGIPLTVLCGGELGHDMVGRLRQGELETIAQGPPGARWLLVETPFEGIDWEFHAATQELRDRGLGVLVAHPERSDDAVFDGSAGLRHELDAGGLAQVNALSLTGGHGDDATRGAFRLAGDGLVGVVGSDAHGSTRPPALRTARARLIDLGVSPALARVLTLERPRCLVAKGIPQRVPLAA